MKKYLQTFALNPEGFRAFWVLRFNDLCELVLKVKVKPVKRYTNEEGGVLVIGVDMVDIDRFKQVVLRTPRLLDRVFTPAEIAYCQNKKDPYPSLAVRFAAKEAVRKLDQLMIQGVQFQDIEVAMDDHGKPGIALHGQAGENSKSLGIETIFLSLSHVHNLAVAVTYVQKG